VLGHQDQDHRCHQQLVGDRIEEAAEVGDLLAAAGEIAVEEIGDAGGGEDAESQPAPLRRIEIEQDDDERDRDDRDRVKRLGSSVMRASGVCPVRGAAAFYPCP